MTIGSLGAMPGRALDDLLARYAAGQLSAPLHILAAGHLSLVAESRAFVQSLDTANGAVLEGIAPVPVTGRDAKLAAIFASGDADPQPIKIPVPSDVLPGPIVEFLGCGIDALRWKTLLPGVKECKVRAFDRGEAVLYWIKPGRRMPSHTHEGSEFTLVLKGGFTDALGHYRRGDIAIADQDVDHRPTADDDEDCICYAVTDAPLRLTGPVGRILQRFLKP